MKGHLRKEIQGMIESAKEKGIDDLIHTNRWIEDMRLIRRGKKTVARATFEEVAISPIYLVGYTE